jgi:phage terminase large subunit-like protein
MEKWDACHVKPEDDITEGLLQSLPCWAGLDLGSTRDLTALALCWPLPDGRMFLRTWGYIPGDDIQARCRRDNVRYDLWAANGHVKLTPGSVTDWRYVAAHIRELMEQYQIQALAYDRWGARDTAREIAEARPDNPDFLVDFGQGYASMSPAVKRMEALIFDKKLIHEGSPTLRWNVDCSSIKPDPAGNVKIVKPPVNKNTRRVDLAVASVMAIGISVSCEPEYDPYNHGAALRFV